VVGLALDGRGDHHVLGLQKTSHDIEHCRLAYTRHLIYTNTQLVVVNDHFLMVITHTRV